MSIVYFLPARGSKGIRIITHNDVNTKKIFIRISDKPSV